MCFATRKAYSAHEFSIYSHSKHVLAHHLAAHVKGEKKALTQSRKSTFVAATYIYP